MEYVVLKKTQAGTEQSLFKGRKRREEGEKMLGEITKGLSTEEQFAPLGRRKGQGERTGNAVKKENDGQRKKNIWDAASSVEKQKKGRRLVQERKNVT